MDFAWFCAHDVHWMVMDSLFFNQFQPKTQVGYAAECMNMFVVQINIHQWA